MIDDPYSPLFSGEERLEETSLISQLLDLFEQGSFFRRDDGTVILNSRLRRLLGLSQVDNVGWGELKFLFLKACGEEGTPEDQEGLKELLDNPRGGQLTVPLSTFPHTIRRCRILIVPLCSKESDVWWGVVVPEVGESGGFLSDQWNALSLMNAVLDGISDAIFLVDEKTLTIQRCNKAASQIFRAPHHQLVGKPIRSFFVNPQKFDDLVPQLEVRLRALGSLHIDTDLERVDGEHFSALCSITGVYDARGYQMAFLWVVSDVSHHVFLNRSHYELETRYRLLFNRIADPTLIIDAQTGQILDCNVAAEQHLGYTRAELIKLTANDVTPSERIEGMKQDFDRIKSGEGSVFEGVNLTKSGEKIPVMVSTVATDLYGKKVFITSTRDISVQKELEAQKLETERLRSVRQTAGGLAHELSQPLQALISLADILERIPPDQWDKANVVERLRVNIDKIIVLLNRMRSLTSVESRIYIPGEEIINLGGSDKE